MKVLKTIIIGFTFLFYHSGISQVQENNNLNNKRTVSSQKDHIRKQIPLKSAIVRMEIIDSNEKQNIKIYTNADHSVKTKDVTKHREKQELTAKPITRDGQNFTEENKNRKSRKDRSSPNTKKVKMRARVIH